MSDAVAIKLREAVRTIQALRDRVAALQAEREPPIAIVGMSCRFAGAAGPGALWDLVASGGDAVRPIPPDRWDVAKWFSPDPDAPGRVAFREAAFLDEVDGFDNELFGIAAREAAQMDPQHRMVLELAWEAIEDAGLPLDRLAGAACGVFLGINGSDHLLTALAAPDRIGSHALAGAVGSIAAGRIAYSFGLSGPAMVVDTACSSSSVAVHTAVRALRSGECTLALAGGVHLMLTPNVSVALSRARMMAPDGRCKAFDAAADGFGQGEGGGMVVLKPLADAEAAGDRVLAVIAGSALNQDGRSAGITAPSQGAQEAVIRAALSNAGLNPDEVDAIEAHGTGTALGDPIELHALAAVFGSRDRALHVGSVKTNIGHTAAAAGVAGLIKAILMLREQAVPPSVHFRRLNPHVELGRAPISVPTALRPQRLSCIGVSSFGFSGTNAHIVLRAAPASPAPAPRGGDPPRRAFKRNRFPRPSPALPADEPGFPGRLIDTPSADRQLECVLDLARQPWLAEHQVHGRIVVPGTVMIALLLAVAARPDSGLADLVFAEPLILREAPERLVAVGRPDGSLGVASCSGTGWLWHATARACEPGAPLGLAAPEPAEWMTRGDWIGHLAALGITIGPAFQGIERIAAGPVSVADLGPALPAEPVGGRFHPALLDAALQVAGGTLPAEAMLPVGIARVTVRGALAGKLRVVARRGGDTVDLEVLADGKPAATVEGLAVRRLADSLPPDLATLAWRPQEGAPGGAERAEIFEVAAGGANLGAALAWVNRRLSDPRPIAFVTRGALPPVQDPAAAQFVGLASALADERPELRCRCIDVASGISAALVEEELRRTDGEPVVALRSEGRFVPRLIGAQMERRPVRLSGTVLITGGLGGIGRHAAGWAVARGAEAVLLVGRSGGVPPRGLPARVLAADVSAPDSIDALSAALAGMPPLRGVIHGAGVLRDGLIERLGEADFAATLAPKLGGAWNLHRLTEHLALDHFLLFGSVASLIGAAGQASYAAANATLDAFAAWRRARGLPATTIAWGRWTAIGMAATLTAGQSARVAARGLLGMTPEAALAALDAAIATGAAVVMAASLDRPRLAATAPAVFAELVPPRAPLTGAVPIQIAAAVRETLGQAVEPGRPLVACGLDSLMAVDLRNRLNRQFGIALGLADLLGGADLAGLTDAVERARAASGAIEEMIL